MQTALTTGRRYLIAAFIVAATVVIRAVMAPLWETTAPFALFMFATVFAAWFAGTGPALVTGAAGALTRLYFDSPVVGGVLPPGPEEAIRLSLFGVFVVSVTLVIDRMKQNRAELEAAIASARREIEERRQVEASLRAVEHELRDRIEQQQRIETELVAARERAEDANRMKDEFLAVISHELRTPLNALMGWVALLRTGVLPKERSAYALDVIDRNANAQARLVSDLLDMATSLTGRLHIEPTHVELSEMARPVVDALRPSADARNITMTFTNGVPVSVWADPKRLEQIVWNLVSNAVKFTPPGGRVDVDVRSRDDFAELAVVDTGRGIVPEFLPYLFQRFRQEDRGATRRHGGLGLGLAITRHLVELHGGTITGESDGEGRGARFTVALPLDVAPAAAPTISQERTWQNR
jgi:signal transduction histidine kinase